MANTNGASWDETVPVASSPRNNGATEILSLRKGVKVRADKEHVAYDAASVGGEHKAGSAKCYYQAAEPTTRPDGSTALTSADYGRLWIDSDDGSLYQYTATGWELMGGGAESFDLPGSPGADEAWSSSLSLPLVVANNAYATPLQISGLSAGRWLLFISGTFDGNQTGDFTITANGQSKTIDRAYGTAGGNIPFMMCIRLTVTSANHYIRITSISGIDVESIDSLTGLFIG